MRFVLLAGALWASACGYRPGSFRGVHSFTGTRSTVGCIDLAIERRPDLIDSPVLDYQFGNRCSSPAPIDLKNVVVVGRSPDGTEVRLHPYDPDREIRPLRLDGRANGHEALAYQAPVALAQVCVDAASLAHEEPARWICLAEGVE